eukprot:4315189-Pyramimonas_sp.AAC.1
MSFSHGCLAVEVTVRSLRIRMSLFVLENRGKGSCLELVASRCEDAPRAAFSSQGAGSRAVITKCRPFRAVRYSHGCRGIRKVFTSAFSAKGGIVHLR